VPKPFPHGDSSGRKIEKKEVREEKEGKEEKTQPLAPILLSPFFT